MKFGQLRTIFILTNEKYVLTSSTKKAYWELLPFPQCNIIFALIYPLEADIMNPFV